MNLLLVIQQSRPELLLELLLPQHELDILASVGDLGLLLVDLGVEFDVQVICLLERIRVASEGQTRGLYV